MLIVIESPNKIKKIKSFIKAEVMATVGHFKDLPGDDLGVDLSTYQPTFLYTKNRDGSDKGTQISEKLKKLSKGEDVYIATDPDREGYAIGTHVYDEISKLAKSCHRLEIHEVTQKGIDEAMKKSKPWHQTNKGFYDAFLGRRVGDRVVGYILSPIAKSALRSQLADPKTTISVGRVQAPAVRLVVEREREIRNFKPVTFFTVGITLDKGSIAFSASHRGGNFSDKAAADAVIAKISGASTATVTKVETKETKQNPKAPFTTVDLQATASSQLRISPEDTMKLAQDLFAAGLISYHRSDSVRIADEFITEIRDHVKSAQGPTYIPSSPNTFKSKNSQADAHEAIRPTHMHSLGACQSVVEKENLGPDCVKLYTLIYQRTVASQMAPAVFDSTLVEFDCAGEPFKATGRVQKFDGFLSLYQEVSENGSEDDDNQKLPALVDAESVTKTGQKLDEKQTKAPGRYSEATLVKALEKHGIGRPSTYASIMGTIKARDYVKLVKGRIQATDIAEKLYDYLAKEHPWVIDLEMTKHMEERLDKVEEGSENWTAFVKDIHSKMDFAAPKVREGGAGGADRPPSDKQIAFAESLAKKEGKAVPPKALKSAREMSAWLDKHVGKSGGTAGSKGGSSGGAAASGKSGASAGGGADHAPSEKQVKYAESLAKRAGEQIPASVLKSAREISAWINSRQAAKAA